MSKVEYKCPQGCSSSYREVPSIQKKTMLLKAMRKSLIVASMISGLFLIGFLFKVSKSKNDESDRQWKKKQEEIELEKVQRLHKFAAINAKNYQIQEEALVRNIAAIEHRCVESKAIPSLKDANGNVIIYVVYVCTSIRRIYRMVNGIWTDTTLVKPVGQNPSYYIDEAIEWQKGNK